jgi:hypothetical protein
MSQKFILNLAPSGLSVAFFVATALIAATPAAGEETKKQEKQQEVRKMAEETLGRLYKAEPTAKDAIARSAGYAVFSNVGVKILVAGSGNGKGIAVDNKNQHETFMKMLEIQGGLGFGGKEVPGSLCIRKREGSQ